MFAYIYSACDVQIESISSTYCVLNCFPLFYVSILIAINFWCCWQRIWCYRRVWKAVLNKICKVASDIITSRKTIWAAPFRFFFFLYKIGIWRCKYIFSVFNFGSRVFRIGMVSDCAVGICCCKDNLRRKCFVWIINNKYF